MRGPIRLSSCACGQVQFEAVGAPIVTAVCYCDDCQEGARRLEALPAAPQTLDDDGGASYLTMRDDRWRCIAGAHLLEGHKLRPKSPTTRYVAKCCNSAMYLKYKRGHWVSTYRKRFKGEALPSVEMCTNTRFRNSPLALRPNVPAYRSFPANLFWRLFTSRLAMVRDRWSANWSA